MPRFSSTCCCDEGPGGGGGTSRAASPEATWWSTIHVRICLGSLRGWQSRGSGLYPEGCTHGIWGSLCRGRTHNSMRQAGFGRTHRTYWRGLGASRAPRYEPVDPAGVVQQPSIHHLRLLTPKILGPCWANSSNDGGLLGFVWHCGGRGY